MRSRLRVAVPKALTQLSPASGIGRWWINTLGELQRIVRLDVIDDGARWRPWRPWGRPRSDVWLGDSSFGPLAATKPVVTLVHEAAWRDPQLRAFLDPTFLAAIESATEASVREAAHVLAASESSRRQVIEVYDFPPERVHAVSPGIDHQVFRPDAPGGPGLVERFGGARGAPYVLYAASIHPRKNLAALREAIAGLAHRGFPHLLVVVGAPVYDRPDWSALAEELLGELPGLPGRVVSVPFGVSDEELAGLMAGAEAFCLPSYMEGLGFPVVEAMACGTTPVVSDRGALPEVVGKAGVVTSPEAPAIEDALADLLADDTRRAALGSAAEQRVSSYTWPRTAREWLKVLQKAAAG